LLAAFREASKGAGTPTATLVNGRCEMIAPSTARTWTKKDRRPNALRRKLDFLGQCRAL
jgi:hypothetical protein